MRSCPRITLVIAIAGVLLTTTGWATERPADRVVVMYFHRTERCPTCRKMGSYTEEAIKKGFARQIEEGSVEFYYVDFQNAKNAALAKGYKVTGPALIIAKIKDNRVNKFTDLKEIWTKVRDQAEFVKYVREGVRQHSK